MPLKETFHHFKNPNDDLLISVAKKNGIDLAGVDINQLMKGIKVEREHDKGDDTDVVKSNVDLLKIAVAHLREDPQYYSKLEKAKLEEMKLTKILKEIMVNQPAPSRPAPSREPMTIPAPTKDPKRGPRRQIGDPAPGVNPKPKAEGLGWDPKKGLTQTPKPPVTKDNKPKIKKEGIEDKIVKRFSNLKK